MQPVPSTPLIPLALVAKRTGRSRELIRRWAVEGRIPAVRIAEGVYAGWYVPETALAIIRAMPKRERGAPR